jgi:hypothetical protein
MTDILNNPWVTGIGGGIVSSLIVFFVTRYFFNKREKKEYIQKIETANNEILYTIRPLIIEKKIPSKDILLAVKISTAKKHGVRHEDLYNEFSLSNDLINEIMGNSFLSSDQKIELSQLLQTMKEDQTSSNKKEIEVVYLRDKETLSSKYNSILLAMISFTTVLTMTIFIATRKGELETSTLLKDKFSLLLAATAIPIVLMTMLYAVKMITDKEKDKKDEHKKGRDKGHDEENIS